jgi:hypothetical protein
MRELTRVEISEHIRYNDESFLIYTDHLLILSQHLINYALCHEDIWGSGDIAPLFLTSELDGGEWSASSPGCFSSEITNIMAVKSNALQWAGHVTESRNVSALLMSNLELIHVHKRRLYCYLADELL